MKRTLLMAAFVAATLTGANAQKVNADKLPKAVKEGFAKQYPHAKAVKWDKEDADYEASFKHEGKELSVVLNAKGEVQEVETEISIAALPMPVQEALKGKKVKEAAEIKKGGKTYYEAEVKGKDLFFDASGKAVAKI